MKKLMLVALTALVAVAFVPAFSADADVTVKGTVAVTKAADVVTAVSVKAADGKVVAVKLDDNGKALAAMDGKAVEVVGAMVKDGDVEVLVVKSSKAAVAE